MLKIGGKTIIDIKRGLSNIAKVMIGSKLIWQKNTGLPYCYIINEFSAPYYFDSAWSFRKLNKFATFCIRQYNTNGTSYQDVGFSNNFLDVDAVEAFANGTTTYFIPWSQHGNNSSLLTFVQSNHSYRPKITDSNGNIITREGNVVGEFDSNDYYTVPGNTNNSYDNYEVFDIGNRTAGAFYVGTSGQYTFLFHSTNTTNSIYNSGSGAMTDVDFNYLGPTKRQELYNLLTGGVKLFRFISRPSNWSQIHSSYSLHSSSYPSIQYRFESISIRAGLHDALRNELLMMQERIYTPNRLPPTPWAMGVFLDHKNRVELDGGKIRDEWGLLKYLDSVTQSRYNESFMVVSAAGGVKNNKLYALKPSDGSQDVTHPSGSIGSIRGLPCLDATTNVITYNNLPIASNGEFSLVGNANFIFEDNVVERQQFSFWRNNPYSASSYLYMGLSREKHPTYNSYFTAHYGGSMLGEWLNNVDTNVQPNENHYQLKLAVKTTSMDIFEDGSSNGTVNKNNIRIDTFSTADESGGGVNRFKGHLFNFRLTDSVYVKNTFFGFKDF